MSETIAMLRSLPWMNAHRLPGPGADTTHYTDSHLFMSDKSAKDNRWCYVSVSFLTQSMNSEYESSLNPYLHVSLSLWFLDGSKRTKCYYPRVVKVLKSEFSLSLLTARNRSDTYACLWLRLINFRSASKTC